MMIGDAGLGATEDSSTTPLNEQEYSWKVDEVAAWTLTDDLYHLQRAAVVAGAESGFDQSADFGPLSMSTPEVRSLRQGYFKEFEIGGWGIEKCLGV